MSATTLEILTAHQRHGVGMTGSSPDTCSCGAKVMPGESELNADGTNRDILERRDAAFAAHQVDALAPKELDATEYVNSYTGSKIVVGDRVKYWWHRKQGTVKRIFKKHPKSVWYLVVDVLGREGEIEVKAADCEVV